MGGCRGAPPTMGRGGAAKGGSGGVHPDTGKPLDRHTVKDLKALAAARGLALPASDPATGKPPKKVRPRDPGAPLGAGAGGRGRGAPRGPMPSRGTDRPPPRGSRPPALPPRLLLLLRPCWSRPSPATSPPPRRSRSRSRSRSPSRSRRRRRPPPRSRSRPRARPQRRRRGGGSLQPQRRRRRRRRRRRCVGRQPPVPSLKLTPSARSRTMLPSLPSWSWWSGPCWYPCRSSNCRVTRRCSRHSATTIARGRGAGPFFLSEQVLVEVRWVLVVHGAEQGGDREAGARLAPGLLEELQGLLAHAHRQGPLCPGGERTALGHHPAHPRRLPTRHTVPRAAATD